jgi:hypothetical protein
VNFYGKQSVNVFLTVQQGTLQKCTLIAWEPKENCDSAQEQKLDIISYSAYMYIYETAQDFLPEISVYLFDRNLTYMIVTVNSGDSKLT